MIHTLESLQELEDYIEQLEEEVGLTSYTYHEVKAAISKERSKLKKLAIADVVLNEERAELPEVGCINSLGCACKEANGHPLTDCTYWQGN